MWIEGDYVLYRGMYGGYFKVRLADIQVVNVDMGGKQLLIRPTLRLIGGGVDLAAVRMARQYAEQARDWILETRSSVGLK